MSAERGGTWTCEQTCLDGKGAGRTDGWLQQQWYPKEQRRQGLGMPTPGVPLLRGILHPAMMGTWNAPVQSALRPFCHTGNSKSGFYEHCSSGPTKTKSLDDPRSEESWTILVQGQHERFFNVTKKESTSCCFSCCDMGIVALCGLARVRTWDACGRCLNAATPEQRPGHEQHMHTPNAGDMYPWLARDSINNS